MRLTTLGWIFRALVAAAIVGALASGGRLSAGPAAQVLARPGVLLALLVLQGLLLLAGALRWWLLLQAIDRRAHPFPRLLLFTWTGQFFGCVAPTAVAMDLTRYGYLRTRGGGSRAAALASLLVDRACGVLGACLLAAVLAHGLLARAARAIAHSGWIPTLVTVLLLAAAALVLASRRVAPERVRVALRVAAAARGRVLLALLIAILAHGLKVLSLWIVVRALNPDVPPGAVFVPAAVGFLAEAVPLTPAGAGTSHLAFEWLLAEHGVLGGAAMFNVVFLARVVVSLAGGGLWIARDGGRGVSRPPSRRRRAGRGAVMRVVAGARGAP